MLAVMPLVSCNVNDEVLVSVVPPVSWTDFAVKLMLAPGPDAFTVPVTVFGSSLRVDLFVSFPTPSSST